MTANRRKWFKSSYSGGANTDCVEVAVSGDGLLVRDSKDAEGPVLGFSRDAWGAFLREVRGGELVDEG
ncbi:protein of unknown function [Actinacidiphila alni]|uniref:DUF397 domain-containing protein n=1 Tax=Actinacidiphila alni TaxID=380248 RepID=A0A1I2JBP2_9ACTN|nr:DUF397 domain-containing protein [Actinacidiphila alni]SFF51400.1 protein of unknown function [Actinacidiphila alni]